MLWACGPGASMELPTSLPWPPARVCPVGAALGAGLGAGLGAVLGAVLGAGLGAGLGAALCAGPGAALLPALGLCAQWRLHLPCVFSRFLTRLSAAQFTPCGSFEHRSTRI